MARLTNLAVCTFLAIVFLLWPLVTQFQFPRPSPIPEKRLYIREEEINPVGPKMPTRPDPGFPPQTDFSVLAKDNLSSWDDQHLVLTSTRLLPGMFQGRLAVANGYIGAAVASSGPFFEKDVNQTNHAGDDSEVTEGWPLWDSRQTFATVSGFWDCQPTTPGVNFPDLQDHGCESVISGIPHPLPLHLQVGDQVLNSTVWAESIGGYTSKIDFFNGTYEWKYTWSPNNTDVTFDIEYLTFLSRVDPTIGATQLKVTPRGGDYKASIIDLLDGRSAKRSYLGSKGMNELDSSIYVSNHPDGLDDVTAWVVSTANVANGYTDLNSRRMAQMLENNNSMTIGQQWDVDLVDGETAVFQKFVGVASTDKFNGAFNGRIFMLPAKMAASRSSLVAYEQGFEDLLSRHTLAWNKLMQSNLITSYRDPETGKLPSNDSIMEKVQIAAVADRYYLLQNLLPDDHANLNDNGVMVGGLTSDTYGGMLFWDQDMWMYPAISLTNPEYARQFIKSRTKQYLQAKANAQTQYVRDYYHFDNKSVLYPWTSGRWGNATATGPVVNYEYHVNTGIALMFFDYLASTGDEDYFGKELWPVVESVGHTIAGLLKFDSTSYKWSIHNMTDPDEYANRVSNGAFTLMSMSQVLHKVIDYQMKNDLKVNWTWIDMADHVHIPVAKSGITMEFDDMKNNITVKQADVTMLTYPLVRTQKYTLKDKERDLAYYSQKQSPDGPAMTHAIAAIGENLVASSGCGAFTSDLQARLPNLRAPWYQMSEQADDDKNANGGVSPAFPFLTGHGGSLQIAPHGYLGVTFTQRHLAIEPSLPFPYRHIQYPDFQYNGSTIRAASNSTHTNVTRIASIHANDLLPFVVGTLHGRDAPLYFSLAMNETLTVANNMYWRELTTPNNILQCQKTNSEPPIVPGQYPGAATDGNPGTRWQPATRNRTRLTVDMTSTPFQQVTKINFDWGARPAERAWVGFTNQSDIESVNSPGVRQVEIPVQMTEVYSHEGAYSHPIDDIVPYIGNRTEWEVPSWQKIWTGKYAILEIEGCKGCGCDYTNEELHQKYFPEKEEMGATVGEFELIGTVGSIMGNTANDENADERIGEPEEPRGHGE